MFIACVPFFLNDTFSHLLKKIEMVFFSYMIDGNDEHPSYLQDA